MAPALAPPAQTDLLAPFEAAYGAQLIGCTVKAIRGIMWYGTSQLNEFVSTRVTAHIGSQHEAARATVAADSAYDPASGGLDYMMFEPFASPVRGVDVGTDIVLPWGSDVTDRVIYVRSQRKLDELNQSLILRASSRSGAGATAANTLNYDLSILVALP